jgi:hypothetical protein
MVASAAIEVSAMQNGTVASAPSEVKDGSINGEDVPYRYPTSSLPMYNTEGSWGNENVTDPHLQAAWLARWYLLQAGISATTNLQTAHWYAWRRGRATSLE